MRGRAAGRCPQSGCLPATANRGRAFFWIEQSLNFAPGSGSSMSAQGRGPRFRPSSAQRDAYTSAWISASELERARSDAYDETIVGDICSGLGSDVRPFDLVLSWQVLEHVASMRAALATQHSALVPGGRMVAMLSGAWSIQAMAARVIPYRLSTALQAQLLDAEAEDKFRPGTTAAPTARCAAFWLKAAGPRGRSCPTTGRATTCPSSRPCSVFTSPTRAGPRAGHG